MDSHGTKEIRENPKPEVQKVPTMIANALHNRFFFARCPSKLFPVSGHAGVCLSPLQVTLTCVCHPVTTDVCLSPSHTTLFTPLTTRMELFTTQVTRTSV